MPPVIVWVIGMLAAVWIGRQIAREWRRLHAELRAKREPHERAGRDEMRTLERDPVTGIYRPK
jgi:hypothetical protein